MKNEIIIDGVKYIKKQDINEKPFVVVRTYSAGVHVGYLHKKEGKEVTLLNSIRIHYWEGAASLSQLSVEGVKKPDKCRFTIPVKKIVLTEAIEIIETTPEAQENIQGVPSWIV